MNVTWTVQGLQPLHNKFEDLKDGLRHNQPILRRSAQAYYSYVETIFDSEGGNIPGKIRWQDLSQTRIAERNGSFYPILDWRGDLRRAATQFGVNSGDEILGGQRIKDNTMRLYLQGEKVLNNFGGRNASGNYVPEREFWPWYDYQQDMAFKPFEDFVDSWLTTP